MRVEVLESVLGTNCSCPQNLAKVCVLVSYVSYNKN